MISSAHLQRMLSLLKVHGPMRAGELGFEMWGKKIDRCRCENRQTTMFTRPATKMLYRAESLGLVRWEEHGRSRVWKVKEFSEIGPQLTA